MQNMVNLTGEKKIRSSFTGKTIRQGAVYTDLRESRGKKYHDEERQMQEGAEDSVLDTGAQKQHAP